MDSKKLQHFQSMLSISDEDLPGLLDRVSNEVRNKKGLFTSVLASDHRLRALLLYLLNRDVTAFRTNLLKAAQAELELIDRFEAGDPIPESFVSILNYTSLFDALASGNSAFTQEFAARIGGKHEIDREHAHPFDITLGYALKATVLDSEDREVRIAALKDMCSQPEDFDFAGYGDAFEAIKKEDGHSLQQALAAIVVGHKRQSKGNGIFDNLVESELSIWGIGTANLARMRGVEFEFDDPLIPAELIL